MIYEKESIYLPSELIYSEGSFKSTSNKHIENLEKKIK
jgi:hypothetical protein